MKTYIILNIYGLPYIEQKYSLSIDDMNDEHAAIIDVDCNMQESFKSIINENNIKLGLVEQLNKLIVTKSEDIKVVKQISKIIKYGLDNERIWIKIGGNISDIKKYIDNNPELKDFPIVIYSNGLNDVSTEFLEEAKSVFKDYNNIYVYAEGNTKEIKIQDYCNTTNYIDSISSQVKCLNLSPLEETLYIYDIVRSRIYKQEQDNEDYHLSRDISNVILGDKIVCVGYTRLFNAILNNLGYNTLEFRLNGLDESNGHMRSGVLINDTKYNINGIYFFDPTWDSKQNEHDKEYLNTYRFYALSNKQIAEYDNQFTDATLYGIDDIVIKKAINQVENNEIHMIPQEITKAINELGNLIDHTSLIKPLMCLDPNLFSNLPPVLKQEANIDKDMIISKIKYYNSLLNSPIPDEIKLKVLINVRKHEYYANPDLFEYSLVQLVKTAYNSNWSISDKRKMLLAAVFNQEYICDHKNLKSLMKAIISQINQSDKKEMQMIRLARTLKTYIQRKKETN